MPPHIIIFAFEEAGGQGMDDMQAAQAEAYFLSDEYGRPVIIEVDGVAKELWHHGKQYQLTEVVADALD